jgi:hypothetical protein
MRSKSYVRQVQQIGHGEGSGFAQVYTQTFLCLIGRTIPSPRPALWQSAARSGSQGCRCEAAAPAEPARSVLDRVSTVLG